MRNHFGHCVEIRLIKGRNRSERTVRTIQEELAVV
jgi:hypothetical protein